MKILCVDSYGESALDWLLRCQGAGHDVKWFFASTPRSENIGKGMVQVVRDWKEWIRWADLVFMADNSKHVRDMDAWRDRGVPILGPNAAGVSWELDRDEGMRVLKRAGIAVPPYREFTSYDAAIAHVKGSPERYVSKPSGVEGDKSLSYCAKDAADMVFQLQRWKKTGKLKGRFILQEFVSGIEFAVGGWFGPAGFLDGYEENWETKPLMNDDCGPNTGEMGTTQRFVRRSKLADKLLRPLEPQLEKIGYVGCVDVSAIIDDQGNAWPLEFTMRPGWPAFQIQQRLQLGDPAEWMVELLEGGKPKVFDLDKVAVGVVIALPDFPFDHAPITEACGIPIYGLRDSIMESVHPSMVAMGEAPQMIHGKVVDAPAWVSAGTYLMTVTGVGDTVTEARKRAYAVVKQIKVPRSPMFRTDISVRLKSQLPKLQALGYATGLQY